MDGPPADEHSGRSAGRRLWYQPDTDRVRPVWRLLVPLIVGLSIYFGLDVAVLAAVDPGEFPVDTGTGLLLLGGTLIASIGATVAVLAVASRLNDRPMLVSRVVPSKPWLRDFGGGVGMGLVASVCMVAVPVTAGTTTMTVDYSGVGVDSVVAGSGIVVGLLGFVLASVVFEELLFRRYVITTVADALGDQSIDCSRATGIAVVVSVVCYLSLKLPLIAAPARYGRVPFISQALIGLLLAAGYVLTGRLALPIGLNLGAAIALNSLYQNPFPGDLTFPSVVVVDTDLLGQSATASVRLEAVRLLVGLVLLWLWVYVFYGDFNVGERIYESNE